MCLKSYNFQLNFRKCLFLKITIEYLGYTISPSGITISERHTDAVRNFPVPINIQQTQRFIGLANYFRKFINNYALKAKPLHNLLKKSVSFEFDETCLRAFNTLKDELVSYPLLQLFDPHADKELHTDASSLALAAILFQKRESNPWAPIAYYSQATNSAESKYHSFELEMLAVLKAIERFHIYLYGQEFVVVTDCHALVYAVNKANLNPRISRWILRLQNYKFKVVHRPGARMAHVDALSRTVALVDKLSLEKELEYRQLQDPVLKIIAENLETSETNDKYELHNGLIYRKGADKPRFAIPEAMVENIIRIYHDDMAHCGVEKTVQGILSNYWFRSIRKRVQNHVDNCLTCLMANAATNTREGEMQLVDHPQQPFQVVHADHFGPITKSSQGFLHILLVLDAHSRFTWLFPTKSTSSEEAIKHLSYLFTMCGNPSTFVSDRGTSFSSKEFAVFLKERQIYHRQIAVAAPWANGLVERVNRFIKSSLKKVVSDASEWPSKLDLIQYVVNNSYHASIKTTLSKLLLGFDQRCHADA